MIRRTDDREKLRRLTAAVFFAAVVLLFVSFSALTAMPAAEVTTRAELGSFDFSSELAHVSSALFSYWPGRLFAPQDFADGTAGDPAYTPDSPNNRERDFYSCGTYRLTLDLPAGTGYGFICSPTYAGKVWVNGQLLAAEGNVSETADGFVPRTAVLTVFFEAGSGPTEIVIQHANYVHMQSSPGALYLGPQQTVLRYSRLALVRSVFWISALFCAFAFFFHVFLQFKGRKQFLWFSLACLFVAVRSLFVAPKPVMLLFPELNWYAGHKAECASLSAAAFCILSFYDIMFDRPVPRKVFQAGRILCAGTAGCYLLLPSVLYSRLTQLFLYLLGGYFLLYLILLLWRVAHLQRRFGTDIQRMLLGGISAATVCALLDILRYHHLADLNLIMTGMLLLVLQTSMALTLELLRVQDALNEAEKHEAEMDRINRTLTDLTRIRSDFMANISHEMKTPLTVMASYAGLTKMQIEKGAVDGETAENLDAIQREAVRLGNLVEQVKSLSVRKEQRLTRARVDLGGLLGQVTDFCRPVLGKNRNTAKAELPAGPLAVYAVRDSVFQVLYNLIANANRHCRGSEIRISAVPQNEFAQICVEDRGSGIDAKILPHVFERGFSGDGSSGLGLALCREIVEESGGTIRIESSSGQGTKVYFTLPREMEPDGK